MIICPQCKKYIIGYNSYFGSYFCNKCGYWGNGNMKSDKCDIPFDTAESCKRKIEQIRISQKQRKMVSVQYRLDLLKKLLTIWDKYESEIHLSNYLDLGQSEFTSKFTTFYQVRGEIIYAIKSINVIIFINILLHPSTINI